jgi:hypothetical protein
MQIRLVRGGIIMILAMIAVFFFYSAPLLEEASGAMAEYEIGSYAPLIAFVFLILANRGILADEKLIRSADRLR